MGGNTHTEMPRYFGIFASIKALQVADSSGDAANLYGYQHADFYNRYVGQEVHDISWYERLLPVGGKVLDLACGGGRITIPLARIGAHVDGIDISSDMLALFNKNLGPEPDEVAKRIRLVQGDITSFTSTDRYDLIILGATSISLLLQPEQRQALFQRVRDHLAPGGRFAFDILDLEGDHWRRLDGYMDVWSSESEAGTEFAIVGQRFYPEDGTFTFNVYRELIGWDGSTSRFLGSSTKAWLTQRDLMGSLEQAGLRVDSVANRDGVLFLVSSAREVS